jgi:hypothetical protein
MATGFQILNILFIFRGPLWLDKVVRRLELLKLEGLGFSQAEIVNELSQNYSHAIARDEKEAGVLIDQGSNTFARRLKV